MRSHAQSPAKMLKNYKKLTVSGQLMQARSILANGFETSGKLKGEFTRHLAEDYIQAKIPDSALLFLNKWKSSGAEGATVGFPELETKAKESQQKAKEKSSAAAKMFEQKNFEEAYNNAKKSLDYDSVKARPYVILARLRENNKDYTKANALFKAALEKETSSAEELDKIKYIYAQSLHRQLENELSNKVLSAINTKEFKAKASLLKAKNYLKLKHYKQCFQELSTYFKPENNLTEEEKYAGYFLKGNAYIERGDRKGAIQAFEAAEKIKPEEFDVQGKLASLHYEEKNYEKSLKYYEQMQKKASPTYFIYFSKGKCFYQLGNIAAAQNAFNEALKLNPDDKRIQFNVGLIAFKNNDLETAQKNWEPLLKGAGRDPVVQLALSKLYHQQKELDKAKAVIDKALKYYRYGVLYETKALIYKELGDETSAKAATEKAKKYANRKIELTVK